MDSSKFDLNLEDKLRQSQTSYNSKTFKLHYQTAIKMVTTVPSDLTGYRKYTEEGGTNKVLPMSTVTEFWLSTVNICGVLYEVVFLSVYSRTDKAKPTPEAANQCGIKFLKSFPGIVSFTQLSLFDEGENGSHDLCNKVVRKINSGLSLDNWK